VSPLWKCEECGGPAVWTFIDELVYYHCERQCDGFVQLDLFLTSGVEENKRGEDALDAGRPLPIIDLPF